MQDRVTEIHRLGFGKCALQVQTPENGLLRSVKDVAGKRVVTSFEVLAGAYFDKLDEQLNLTGDQKTKIQYIGGSVEAACSLGLADAIGESPSQNCNDDAYIFSMLNSRSCWYVLVSGLAWKCLTTFQNPETRCEQPVCTLSRQYWKQRQY